MLINQSFLYEKTHFLWCVFSYFLVVSISRILYQNIIFISHTYFQKHCERDGATCLDAKVEHEENFRKNLSVFWKYVWDKEVQIGDSYLSASSVTRRVKRHFTTISCRTRPCIKVRILPFHFCITAKLFPKESIGFRLWRLCSHLCQFCPLKMVTKLSIRRSFSEGGLPIPKIKRKLSLPTL